MKFYFFSRPTNCSEYHGIYDSGDGRCRYCHHECLGECSGPGDDECKNCRHLKDETHCVEKCPPSKYEHNGTCIPCHPNCIGCNGPGDFIGPGGCTSCSKAIVSVSKPYQIHKCLNSSEICPDGFYQASHINSIAFFNINSVCRRCHPRCQTCTAYGIHVSICHCLYDIIDIDDEHPYCSGQNYTKKDVVNLIPNAMSFYYYYATTI